LLGEDESDGSFDDSKLGTKDKERKLHSCKLGTTGSLLDTDEFDGSIDGEPLCSLEDDGFANGSKLGNEDFDQSSKGSLFGADESDGSFDDSKLGTKDKERTLDGCKLGTTASLLVTFESDGSIDSKPLCSLEDDGTANGTKLGNEDCDRSFKGSLIGEDESDGSFDDSKLGTKDKERTLDGFKLGTTASLNLMARSTVNHFAHVKMMELPMALSLAMKTVMGHSKAHCSVKMNQTAYLTTPNLEPKTRSEHSTVANSAQQVCCLLHMNLMARSTVNHFAHLKMTDLPMALNLAMKTAMGHPKGHCLVQMNRMAHLTAANSESKTRREHSMVASPQQKQH
jgi:hypothetical protein